MKQLLPFLFLATLIFAADPEIRTAEEAARLAAGGDLYLPETKYKGKRINFIENDPMPDHVIKWNMGPTGIIGFKNASWAGDQVRVLQVLPDSPAHGKIQRGDVILGIGGQDYKAGTHLGVHTGNAIIKAEEESGGGKLHIRVWRDRNWLKRNAAAQVKRVRVDDLFAEAEQEGEAELFDWQDENSQDSSIGSERFKKFPPDPLELEFTLQLEVMGTYSDTSPWDCPVAEKIRENAWAVLESKFGKIHRNRNGTITGTGANSMDAVALVASGKPEHRQLVKDWVATGHYRPWQKSRGIGGMSTWNVGFWGMDLGIYYDATQDKQVLPRLREISIYASERQQGGGTWGHGMAGPNYNGGDVWWRNGGYGAMNNCGGRVFAMLTLAQKAGIDHPAIDTAIRRSARFFQTYVDKGAVPYGFHPPVAKDDSNGKNMGPALAFHVLGNEHATKYYAQNSAHASFTRRGGHGSSNLWHYSPYAGALAGPKGVQAFMRNMRWFYTLARRHDGSFILQCEERKGIGGKEGMSATAYNVLYYSHPFKQTIITGKDANTNLWFTDRELERLLVSARKQLQDPVLIAKSGTPATSRPTPELIELLDVFFPKHRHQWATTIGERIKNGERETLPKAIALLERDNPRYREAGLIILEVAGENAVVPNMSKIVPLLNDEAEFVRMAAVKTLASATGYDPNARYRHLFEAAADDYAEMTMDHGNLRRAVLNQLFSGGGKKSSNRLTTTPFAAGLDENLVAKGLGEIITMDPGGYVSGNWSKDTVIRLAGPLTHVAEFVQVNDAMFGGMRTFASRKLLNKHGFHEGLEASTVSFLDYHLMPKHLRTKRAPRVACDLPVIHRAKGQTQYLLEPMHQLLRDHPTLVIRSFEKGGPTISLADLVDRIAKEKPAKLAPSLRNEVAKQFRRELATVDANKRIETCRAELKDPYSFWIFRQMVAMDVLAEQLGPDVIDDVWPFLAVKQYRLRAHSQEVAKVAVKSGALARFAELLKKASPETVARALPVLAGAGKGVEVARSYLKQDDPLVRQAAIEAVFALDPTGSFDLVCQTLQTSKDPDVLAGCENALLSKLGDAAYAKRATDALAPMLTKTSLAQQRVIAHVLGRFGGDRAVTALRDAAIKDEGELRELAINGLSQMSAREVDETLLELARKDKTIAAEVSKHMVRRLVIGPNGINDVTDDYRVKLARKFLNIHYSVPIVNYLASVNTPDAINLLFEIMTKSNPDIAAQSIITSSAGIKKLSPAESKKLAKTLTQVMEFIEVTYIRKGPEGGNVKDYAIWHKRLKVAGKTLLKFHNPVAAAPPDFNEGDLDF